MKQDPPTFRVTYNDSGSSEDQKGFKPYRNEAGEWVNSRTVILKFLPWKGGACLRLEIEEEYSHPDFKSGILQTRRVGQQEIFDHLCSINEYTIVPTITQAYQFRAILEGGLRGEWAANMVRDLYNDLFVMNPKSILGEYLPGVKAQFINTLEFFNMDWTQESK